MSVRVDLVVAIFAAHREGYGNHIELQLLRSSRRLKTEKFMKMK